MGEGLRLVYMGTPDFAVEPLRRLAARFDIVAAVTAPDKPRGRGQELSGTPVKEFCMARGIPVLQPANLKSEEFRQALELLNPDLAVVVAFRMLPQSVWSLPRLGSVNLHASLLPQYRGAAPINHAIINGETRTGVTTFFLQHEIDTGDIIRSREVEILPGDDVGTLHDRLMEVGAEVLEETVADIAAGNYASRPQPVVAAGELRGAPKLTKEFCRIDWRRPGREIHNFVRGLSPYPGAFTQGDVDGKMLGVKIFKGQVEIGAAKAPGTVAMGRDGLKVATGDGWYHVWELQPAGRKRMAVGDFINGLNGKTLSRFEP